MSTRANIQIIQKCASGDAESIFWLYHHHDGYPRGLGASIIQTLNEKGVLGEGRNFTASGIATILLQTPEPIYSDGNAKEKNEFELTTGMHGDIEFLYTIRIHADGFTCIRCNAVYCGDDGKQIIGNEIDLANIEKEAKVFDAVKSIDVARWFNCLTPQAREELVDECVEFIIPEKWGAYLDREYKKSL